LDGDARAGSNHAQSRKEAHMLWTIAVILIVLWLLGLLTGYTLGYFIHILLVIAIIVLLVGFISGRRSL
jgi:F0F1-type ATP synthase assembly protein I